MKTQSLGVQTSLWSTANDLLTFEIGNCSIMNDSPWSSDGKMQQRLLKEHRPVMKRTVVFKLEKSEWKLT